MSAGTANRAGDELDGDKRRTIEMVLATAEGKTWTQEAIAKHCGVARSWVGEVVGKCRTDISPTQEQKRAAVVAAVAEAPKASNREIAKAAGVDHKTVAAVRAAPMTKPEPPRPYPVATIVVPSLARVEMPRPVARP